MSFKDTYLELWRLFCSAEQNPFCNFGRGQLCEVILNLGQWFGRRSCLKDFSSRALAAPPVYWSRTIYAILVEGIEGNIL